MASPDSNNSGDELESSVRRCTGVLQSCPDNVEALRKRAEAWRQLGQFQRALDDYASLVKQEPKVHFAYVGQARIWATCPDERFRDGAKAVKSALKGYKLAGPGAFVYERGKGAYVDTSVFTTLAAAYAEAGNIAKANEALNEATVYARDDLAKETVRLLENALRKNIGYREPAISSDLADRGTRLSELWA